MDDRKRNLEQFDLEALRGGDKAEFTTLVDAYSGVILCLALKMLA
jgi:hypothetical protein